jgi:hypothetical protein
MEVEEGLKQNWARFNWRSRIDLEDSRTGQVV